MKNIFLTGRPGVGKTTLLVTVVQRLPEVAGGFYTEELRDRGKRVGFKIRTLDGAESVLAHVHHKGPHRVGKYGVNVEAFEKTGVRSIEAALERPGAIVMDELGRMELFSEKFQRAALRALDAPNIVIGVIQDRKNPFLDAIRARPDTTVFRVTPKNRDSLVDEIFKEIGEAPS